MTVLIILGTAWATCGVTCFLYEVRTQCWKENPDNKWFLVLPLTIILGPIVYVITFSSIEHDKIAWGNEQKRLGQNTGYQNQVERINELEIKLANLLEVIKTKTNSIDAANELIEQLSKNNETWMYNHGELEDEVNSLRDELQEVRDDQESELETSKDEAYSDGSIEIMRDIVSAINRVSSQKLNMKLSCFKEVDIYVPRQE